MNAISQQNIPTVDTAEGAIFVKLWFGIIVAIKLALELYIFMFTFQMKSQQTI